MALTDEQRGARAAWLYHHRVAQFGPGAGGQQALAEELRQRGLYRAPETIKGWEASDERSPIPPELVPVLEEIFRDHAPMPKRVVTMEDVVAAMDRQTEAINALVARLDVIAQPLGQAVAGWLREQLREANGEPELAPTSPPVRPPSARSPQGAG
jgi:hypothetical protein